MNANVLSLIPHNRSKVLKDYSGCFLLSSHDFLAVEDVNIRLEMQFFNALCGYFAYRMSAHVVEDAVLKF